VTYTEASPGNWNYNVTMPAADLPAGAATSVASGSLTFDDNGNLTSPAAGAPINIAVPALEDGANAMSIN
jgi:hypothetical protein